MWQMGTLSCEPMFGLSTVHIEGWQSWSHNIWELCLILRGRREGGMAGWWSQHHQEWLLLVPVIQECQGPVIDEVSVVVLTIAVSMLLCHTIHWQGVIVVLRVSNLSDRLITCDGMIHERNWPVHTNDPILQVPAPPLLLLASHTCSCIYPHT